MTRALLAGLLLAGVATSARAADPAAGQKIFRSQCGICHSVAARNNMLGPTLFGVVGRKAGTVPDYTYSTANKTSGLTWDEATLERYLQNPKAMVPGTKMTYAGLKDPEKRADLIAYLATVH